jgi:hypothetical protein
VDLFQETVVPLLEMNGFKTYGVKSRLVEFIRTTNAIYANDQQFLDAFMPWLQLQTRNVRGGKTTPVLKPFSVMGMSRPAWPEALKQLKGVIAGDNVRHVVRNATLKRALDVAWDRAGMSRKAVFTQLATDLQIPVAASATDGDIAKQIYNTLYLHPDNLFAGDGPRNQIIGFAADPVRAIGEDLLGQDGDVDIVQVYTAVMKAIHTVGNSEKIKVEDGYRQFILHEIDDIVREAIGALRPNEQTTMVPAEQAGELVADIGLGFGFDLIDGRVADDVEGIAVRQGRLFWAEKALGAYIDSGGQGDLTFAFKVFLGQANPRSG